MKLGLCFVMIAVFQLCSVSQLSNNGNGNSEPNNNDNQSGKSLNSPIPSPPNTVFASFDVGNFKLTLRDWKGNCMLVSKNLKSAREKNHYVSMASPCNFLRLLGDHNDKIMTYDYKTKGVKRIVALIVGGEPNPNYPDAKDAFFPNGCGMYMDRVFVFEDRVEVENRMFGKEYPSADIGPPRCPTGGADEMEFAW